MLFSGKQKPLLSFREAGVGNFLCFRLPACFLPSIHSDWGVFNHGPTSHDGAEHAALNRLAQTGGRGNRARRLAQGDGVPTMFHNRRDKVYREASLNATYIFKILFHLIS
jgi:hypothetical protein